VLKTRPLSLLVGASSSVLPGILTHTVKIVFPSPAGMSLTKLSLARNKYLLLVRWACTVIKVRDFPVPSREITYQTLHGRVIIKLFLARESLVSLVRVIQAGERKIINLFSVLQL
jgi:hypothetical protein